LYCSSTFLFSEGRYALIIIMMANLNRKSIRNRPFNLQGELWFFVSFRIFFSDNTRVRIFPFFYRAKREFFFPEFNIRLYDKHSESNYYIFRISFKIRIFFSATLGIGIFF
jgi:hypothetical protein